MHLSNRALVLLCLAPNVAYVAALAGLMGWRIISGLQPLPQGTTPLVMVLGMTVPMASAALGNIARFRRRR